MKAKEEGWWRFLTLCAQFKTPRQLNDFFELFLTLQEKEDLAKRTLIVEKLLEGKQGQREIAEELKVSISKITRGSNALKLINKNLKEILKHH